MTIVPFDIPYEHFHFQKQILNSWADGQQRLLVAGRDFPREMSFKEARIKLRKAAAHRMATIYLWPDGDGNIMMIMGTPGSADG